jgi:hypothetical protein
MHSAGICLLVIDTKGTVLFAFNTVFLCNKMTPLVVTAYNVTVHGPLPLPLVINWLVDFQSAAPSIPKLSF